MPSDINLTVIYLLNLLATVLSYWLFAYKGSLFQAHQRTDIISKINLIVKTFQYVIQFVILYLFKNYYSYLIISLLAQIMINIITALYANKCYPDYKAIGKIEKLEKKNIDARIKDLFVAKVGGVIVNSVDTIVISSFLGLTVLGTYQNYYYIITAVSGLIAVLFNACSAGIGNSIVVENEEKNYEDLGRLTFIVQWISANAFCLLLNLYQPFIKLWVGEKFLLEIPLVICFCIYLYVNEINQLLNMYKDAAGIWKKDKLRIIITGSVNLILNLILVNYIGLYGIILSTIISILFVGMPWLIQNLFNDVFKRKAKKYSLNLIKKAVVTVIIGCISYLCCYKITGNGILVCIIRGIVTLIVANAIWYMVYKNTTEMDKVKNLLKFVFTKKDDIK